MAGECCYGKHWKMTSMVTWTSKRFQDVSELEYVFYGELDHRRMSYDVFYANEPWHQGWECCESNGCLVNTGQHPNPRVTSVFHGLHCCKRGTTMTEPSLKGRPLIGRPSFAEETNIMLQHKPVHNFPSPFFHIWQSSCLSMFHKRSVLTITNHLRPGHCQRTRCVGGSLRGNRARAMTLELRLNILGFVSSRYQWLPPHGNPPSRFTPSMLCSWGATSVSTKYWMAWPKCVCNFLQIFGAFALQQRREWDDSSIQLYNTDMSWSQCAFKKPRLLTPPSGLSPLPRSASISSCVKAVLRSCLFDWLKANSHKHCETWPTALVGHISNWDVPAW